MILNTRQLIHRKLIDDLVQRTNELTGDDKPQ